MYSNWKRACKNLGIEGVDLYGGTKYSAVKAMRQHFTPDQIQRGTGIVSNKAFERYFQHEFGDELKIYEKRNQLRHKAQAGKVLAKSFKGPNKAKVLKIKD